MEYYLEKIKRGGLKLTPRRKAIVELFILCDSHLTPEAVWGRLQNQFDQCGLPSVYRNLESLAECGILTRIQQFDSKKHYGLCTSRQNQHHHHIICIKCGKVDDIDDCALLNRKKIKGYKVISHYVQVNGVCTRCSGR
ncbi:Fur family transcriptional regulator [Thermodesulfobacteriota bacterium]